jgi:hypothetical protein
MSYLTDIKVRFQFEHKDSDFIGRMKYRFY